MLAVNRNSLILLAGLLLVAEVFLVFFHYQGEYRSALDYAGIQIQNSLHSHRALHSYVEDIQKPEIYRLKDTGKLYPEYFSPEVLSFTFIARNVQQFLQQEREAEGLPPIRFKLAATNPRNPINQADPYEAELLRRMNETGLDDYQAVIEEGGDKQLYVALPITPNRHSCMRCHGDPQDAPRELIEMYGPTRGFFEELGEHRALVSIRMPIDEALRNVVSHTWRFGLLSLVMLALVFFGIAYFVVRLDREQRKVLEQNQALETLSTTDVLTGLLNRHGFDTAFEKEIRTARRYASPLSLILMDLDHFKAANDAFGHLEGDRILRQVGDILQAESRETDISARWGGEEFILLLPHTDLAGARQSAEGLRRRIKSAGLAQPSRLTASFGVTRFEADDSAASLLSRVDKALYQAKEQGRNRVVSIP